MTYLIVGLLVGVIIWILQGVYFRLTQTGRFTRALYINNGREQALVNLRAGQCIAFGLFWPLALIYLGWIIIRTSR